MNSLEYKVYFAIAFASLGDLARWLSSDDQVIYIRKMDLKEVSLEMDSYEALIFGFKRSKE